MLLKDLRLKTGSSNILLPFRQLLVRYRCRKRHGDYCHKQILYSGLSKRSSDTYRWCYWGDLNSYPEPGQHRRLDVLGFFAVCQIPTLHVFYNFGHGMRARGKYSTLLDCVQLPFPTQHPFLRSPILYGHPLSAIVAPIPHHNR